MVLPGEKASNPEYGAEVFTGIRPTSDLTIANYLGAVREIVDLQEEFEPVVFVADVHGLTDQDPETVAKHREAVVKDYLALGVDPERTELFMQSHILPELSSMTLLLSREITLNRLTNVPTLKDKLGDDADPLSARVMLGLYPVLMASDILAQRARLVPVGKDQIAHIELTRELADSFNSRNGETFPMPEAYIADDGSEPLRILSLKGSGKMSKSQPNSAIFLTDSSENVEQKLKRAQTGPAGVMTPHITSLIQVVKGLTQDTVVHDRVDEIIADHMDVQPVMRDLKILASTVINDFLSGYKAAEERIAQDPDFVHDVLTSGNARAQERAEDTLQYMRDKLKI